MPLPPPCEPPPFDFIETSTDNPTEVFVLVGGRAEGRRRDAPPGEQGDPGRHEERERERYHAAIVAWRGPDGRLLNQIHTAVDVIGAVAFVVEATARIRAKWDNARIRMGIDIGRWATGVIVPCPPPRSPNPVLDRALLRHLLRDVE